MPGLPALTASKGGKAPATRTNALPASVWR